MSKTIALISPSQKAYSETFIQAHKNFLDGEVRYYYGGNFPDWLEGREESLLRQLGLARRLIVWLKRRLTGSNFHYVRNEALKASFKREGVSIVMAEYGPTAAEILDVCIDCKLPLVVHFHGYDANVDLVVAKYRSAYLRVFNYASRIIAVSSDMKAHLTELGAEPSKIVLTACAPADEFFDVRARYDTKKFLAVGRFVDKKAPYYTMLAFAEVLKQHPDAQLSFVGDGPLFNATKNLARWLGITENTHFLGAVDHNEVMGLFSDSIAYVQHSITADNGDKEGTPVAVLEAGAAGVCVISTRHAGIGEVVIDQRTGLLVDEHDVRGMSSCMMRLFDEPELAKRLGSAARKHIKSNYRMDVHISTLDKAITDSVKKIDVKS